MYKYRVDDDTTKRVVSLAKDNTNRQKIDDLIEKLKAYNNIFDYSDKVDIEPVNFERMKDVVIDESAIKSQAENELNEYKTSTIEDITEGTKSKIIKLEKDKETSKNNYETAMESARDYYADVKENASNDALRRGLSRSSIVINIMDAFGKQELAKYNELNDTLTETINNIDNEISSLNQRQDEALASFDITYAVKLQDKINSLKQDLLDKQEKVLQYNNEIAEKEAEFNRKYAELEKELRESNFQKEQDLMEYAGKYGVNMLAKYKTAQTYNMAEEYLDTLDKDTARDELYNNETLRSLLCRDNITKLLERYTI